LYEKQFTFPELAHNEYAVSQLQALEVAQGDLNADPDSKVLFNRFLQAADTTATNLQQRYPEYWTRPSAKPSKQTAPEWSDFM